MKQIVVATQEIVPISELKVDGKNPNRMDRATLDRLKASIEKFGFIDPIITNKDLLIADGEKRWTAAKEFQPSFNCSKIQACDAAKLATY